ncbi:hypothetical protein MSAN_02002500 [Mycena sanguinolenta]|uniref:SAM domain-containing protein n=1 Tax=Mycena sanguinolenta TaxID=230812 RepID=A0A8H6XKF8_9AGAR|nr:hypothetical protein MSAN_02002500 [Mycena sanguinolenta]
MAANSNHRRKVDYVTLGTAGNNGKEGNNATGGVGGPDGVKVQGLNVSMDEFCCKHCLGQEIRNLLRMIECEKPSSLPHLEDQDLLKHKFKIGHIAELKWVLRKLVGRDFGVPSRKPDLHGGIGGKGGDSPGEPGAGGEGHTPVVPKTYLSRFLYIFSGIGGEGGSADPNSETQSAPGQRREQLTLWEKVQRMLPFRLSGSEGPYLFGGIGGKGGYGPRQGGEGGVGEATRVSIEFVSYFQKIFGGIGGEGGAGRLFGGNGGNGQGSVFSEPLGRPENAMSETSPTLLANYRMDEDLRKVLSEQGFVTVGALFMVTGDDLAEVGFKLGRVADLKEILINNIC